MVSEISNNMWQQSLPEMSPQALLDQVRHEPLRPFHAVCLAFPLQSVGPDHGATGCYPSAPRPYADFDVSEGRERECQVEVDLSVLICQAFSQRLLRHQHRGMTAARMKPALCHAAC